MRTFHTGGVASTADITQGLPRVQELFEARKPKGKATIAEFDGEIVSITRKPNGDEIKVRPFDETLKEKSYIVDATVEKLVKEGSKIKRGERLVKGSIHPKELLQVVNAEAVQKYIVEEVQKVYQSQGVEISDKHIEIIVRQMMRKIEVVTEGSTNLLPDRQVSIKDFKEATKQALQVGGELPVGKPVLLGITKAALASDSFLSASSFQETTKILTAAAIRSKVDKLVGLKENVIIGGLIPAGTGILQIDNLECEHRPDDGFDLDENLDFDDELDTDSYDDTDETETVSEEYGFDDESEEFDE